MLRDAILIVFFTIMFLEMAGIYLNLVAGFRGEKVAISFLTMVLATIVCLTFVGFIDCYICKKATLHS